MASRSSGQRPNKVILSRTLILMLVCGIVAFVLLIGNLYKIMIKDHNYYEQLAIERQTRETTVFATRGSIYDANGNVLAMSATAYTVFISPYEMQRDNEDPRKIAEGLSSILGVDKETILKKSENVSSWYETVALKVESEVADKVREFKGENGFNSIHIETDSKRYYPNGSLACHIIGFVGTDDDGLEGIEAVYNDYLEGTDGSISRLTTAEGTKILYSNYEEYTDAIDGSDLKLTIDVNIQSIAEKYLAQAIEDNDIENGGCCIVMDTNTGAILALACANDYDLNDPWKLSDAVQEELDKITDEKEYSEARVNAQRAQWRNMAISDTYEPGSVFKTITMAMALEENVISTDSSFYCGGSMEVLGRTDPLNCWRTSGHGSQTLKQAAQHSCNVAFVDIGLDIGAETFYKYVDAFGLFDRTGIDLSGEANSQWWTRDVFFRRDNLSQLAAASFGQTFNVTPIQMITAVAAVANEGKLMEPYIVSEISRKSGEVVYSHEPTVVREVLSKDTSRTVCDILEAVVGEEGGTGKNAYVAGYKIAGKTGTTTKTSKQAETGEKEYMVSFCGIAPANDPDIAVLLILDNPSKSTKVYVSGGAMAAPSVGSIISETLDYFGVEREYTEEEKALLDVTVPKVIDSSVETARARLEELGLTVRVAGEGETVMDQIPAVNAEVATGSEVLLYTERMHTDELVPVPDLTGMTFEDARLSLSYVGLYMNTSGALPTDSGIVVSSQSAEPGTEIGYGSIIKVVLIDQSNLGQY